MADKGVTVSGGIGFSGLLTIVFIVLKLIGKINWAWIWVLSPLWVPVVLILSPFLMAFIIGSIRVFKRSLKK
jgi:hypothetical protein